MKFHLKTPSERYNEKVARLSKWHRWFAWYPVRMTNNENEVCWLEFIYRRGTVHLDEGEWWTWEYVENEFDILRQSGK